MPNKDTTTFIELNCGILNCRKEIYCNFETDSESEPGISVKMPQNLLLTKIIFIFIQHSLKAWQFWLAGMRVGRLAEN